MWKAEFGKGKILFEFFIIIGDREIYITGVTPNPDEIWVKQIARNVTMEEWGFMPKLQHQTIQFRFLPITPSWRAVAGEGGYSNLTSRSLGEGCYSGLFQQTPAWNQFYMIWHKISLLRNQFMTAILNFAVPSSRFWDQRA